MSARDQITGVVLAGGRARRMGGQDKGLVELAGRPMIEHVLEVLGPQVSTLVINANRNPERYGEYGFPVVADSVPDFSGPLAGMLAALDAAHTPYVLSCPCDCPLLPPDLAGRMYDELQRQGGELAAAHNGERLQPVFALLPVSLRDSLQAFLAAGERKIDRWFDSHGLVTVDFSDRPEAFMNVNTPEECEALGERLGNGQR